MAIACAGNDRVRNDPRDLLMDGEVAARREIAPRIAAIAPAKLQIVIHRIHSGGRDVPQQGRGRGAITILDGRGSTNQVCSARRLAELFNAEEIERVAMMAINKQRGRHKIEELLPWHATGTLSRRDADRVEQALAGDRELARRYELVRQELAETTRLNETLGAPSARAMEKLFAAINAEEARAPRRRRRSISWTRFLTSARDSAREKPSFTK